MLFQTPEFVIFTVIILALYYLTPKHRLSLLAVVNILFYVIGGLGYLLLFMIIAMLTYLCSLHLHRKIRKVVFWAAIGLNVFNLAFFKYSIFVLNSLEKALSVKLLVEGSFLTRLALPLGISFYTFMLIAYIVDVYQEKIEPSRSWLQFWVYISFFAHIMAGPIMRGKDMIPQVERLSNLRFDSSNITKGLSYFALGLFKKLALADMLAGRVNAYYATGTLTGGEAWLAAYLFAFQIYFDFSAYSEMAKGVGHLFGINLNLNFNTPYLSANGSEFWRRWHITLSNWIRDYIYIPLGGSRFGTIRLCTSILLAMGISGLWHGAAWTFIAWGLFHGCLLIGHKLYTRTLQLLRINIPENAFIRVISVFIFFQLTCIGWVLFKVSGFRTALSIIREMLTFNPLMMEKALYTGFAFVIFLFLLHIAEYMLRKHITSISHYWCKFFPAPVRGLVYTALIVMFALLLQSEQNSFIYFQF